MISSEISYSEAQSNLGTLLDRVADNKDIIIVKRDGTGKNVALIAETDLRRFAMVVSARCSKS